MDSIYIVMPAYNEEENISEVIKQWHPIVEKIGSDSRLIIVDDGSKDSTFKIMKDLEKDFPCFNAITKPNSGHGATCLYTYDYSINKGADFIFQTDSDGQTSPEEFWQFWNQRNDYDFIVGSRKGREDGISRKIVTRVLKLFVLVTMGVYVEDANTPFRLMRTDVLKKHIKLVPKDFFLSNVLLSSIFVLKKEKCKWIPITFKDRQGGVNSINIPRIIKIGFKAMSDFVKAKKHMKLVAISE